MGTGWIGLHSKSPIPSVGTRTNSLCVESTQIHGNKIIM